jgi:hypothetical protein
MNSNQRCGDHDRASLEALRAESRCEAEGEAVAGSEGCGMACMRILILDQAFDLRNCTNFSFAITRHICHKSRSSQMSTLRICLQVLSLQ